MAVPVNNFIAINNVTAANNAPAVNNVAIWDQTVSAISTSECIFKIPKTILDRASYAQYPSHSLPGMPTEIQQMIFSNLTLKELVEVSQTCKELGQAVVAGNSFHLNPKITYLGRDFVDTSRTFNILFAYPTGEHQVRISKYNTYKLNLHPSRYPRVSNIELHTRSKFQFISQCEFLTHQWFQITKMDLLLAKLPQTRGMLRFVAQELLMACMDISKTRGTYVSRYGSRTRPQTSAADDLAEAQKRFQIFVNDSLALLNFWCPA